MSTLNSGDMVSGAGDGQRWQVGRLIGCGAQGCVYEALGPGGTSAIKWFVDEWASDAHRATIAGLVATPAPSPHLVWPQAIVTCADRPGFGYVMPLVERPRHVELADVMSRRVEPTHTALVAAALTVARAVAALHERKLCYRDLSHANIMLDPVLGHTRVFDVDNVAPFDQLGTTGIAGTPGYLAPETLTAGAKVGKAADLHALAVLIFVLLVNHHPLKGKRELAYQVFDAAAQNELYGKKALFIHHPKRDDNWPDPVAHPNAIAYWAILPTHVRQRFHAAFVTNLGNLTGRVTAEQWIETLERLADGIYLCPGCGAELYDDPASGAAPHCWGCDTVRSERLFLESGSTRLTLHPGRTAPGPALRGTVVRRRHLRAASRAPSDIVARVIADAKNDGTILLENASDVSWTAGIRDGPPPAQIQPGDHVAIRDGLWIVFGGGDRAAVRQTAATPEHQAPIGDEKGRTT